MRTVSISQKPVAPSTATDRLAVSVKEAATLLGVSERSIRTWTQAGKIHAKKLGARVLYPVASLENLLQEVDATDVE